MKIALLAPFEESIPPKKYGGTELIIYHLAQILSKKHTVFLLATGDSKTKAKLIPIFPKAIRNSQATQDMRIRDAIKYMGIAKVVKELKEIKVDIIHNHIGWRFIPFAPLLKVPILTTLHGPLDVSYQQFVYGNFKKFPFVSISNSQRKPFPTLNYAATVYNGIDLKQFKFKEKPQGDYFAFLARMSPEKGPLQAIQAAKMAGYKLKIAAKIDAVDTEFFEKKVKLLIDGKQIKFLGEIGSAEKSEFLNNARGLLVPLQWEEPFGLFMIEAMACGTPVIAFDRGSVKEIVTNEETGFVVKTVREMAEAMKNIHLIKRIDCRLRVEEKFTAEKMVANYEKIYQKLAKK